MKHKRIFLLLAMLFALACSGCAEPAPKEAKRTVPAVSAQTETIQSTVRETQYPASAEELLEIGIISGTVVECSDMGCRISPTRYEEGVAYEAAPGYETELVAISYGEGCTFQIANVNVQTGSVAYEPAGVKDIAAQTSLVIQGEYDDSGTVQGKTVYIYRSIW